MGGDNLLNTVANVATGGLYGAGKGAETAITTGKVGKGFDTAMNSAGPWGMTTEFIDPNIARTGNIMGAGAGIGGGLAGGFQGGGFGAAAGGPGTAGYGAAGSAASPYYFGFEPDTLAAAGTSEFGQFGGAGVPTGGMMGAPAASLAGGGNMTGAMLGAQGAQQLGQMLPGPGGMAPLSMPGGGAGNAQNMTPQQRAALLGAMQSESHRGLSPRFEDRMKGAKEQPGLSTMDQYYQGQ